MKILLKKVIVGFTFFAWLAIPLFAADPDMVSPQIDHQTATEFIKGGTAIKIGATVMDNVGVKSVTLFYRTESLINYRTLAMGPEGGENQFTATIPGDEVVGPRLEYYIQAVDVNGNTVTRGGRYFPLQMTLILPTPLKATAESNKNKEKKKYTWAWWVGGGLLLGAVALASGGGGNNGGGVDPAAGPTGTVSFTGPQP